MKKSTKTTKAKAPKGAKAKPNLKSTAKPAAYARVTQTYVLDKRDQDNLQPQGKMILAIIATAQGRLERSKLLERLAAKLKASGSKQSATRVLSFYKQILVGGHYVKIEKSGAPAKPKKTAPLAPRPAACEDPEPPAGVESLTPEEISSREAEPAVAG